MTTPCAPSAARGRRAARTGLAAFMLACALTPSGPARAVEAYEAAGLAAAVTAWRARFAAEVARRLEPPDAEFTRYALLARESMSSTGRAIDAPQFVLVVDRDAQVQAALLMLARPSPQPWLPIGAAPVATGRPGGFEHFLTPLGAFEHTLANPDFRAEGTVNENGIRGYGAKGMRVFDFGWVEGLRTWDDKGSSPMRLQVHATDPARLEPLLGQRASKGCVRIPAALNRFLDLYGVLDADYATALARGERLWMLDAARTPAPWPGRWLVVVDTARTARPAWSSGPAAAAPRLSPPRSPGAARAPSARSSARTPPPPGCA